MTRRFMGMWRPGRFPEWVALAISITLTGMMFVRGWDYIRASHGYPLYWVSKLEDVVSLDAWGVGFVSAAFTIMMGMAVRRGRMIVLGHLLATCLYTAVATGLFQLAVENNWQGLRFATSTIGIGLVHFFFTIGTHMRVRQLEILIERGCDNATRNSCCTLS